jgi:hypothetical protein
VILLGTPLRSNCLIWALRRRCTHHGHIGARWSLHLWGVPHFLWSSDRRRWWGYVPAHPLHGWRGLVDCLWFVGLVEMEAL